MASIIKAHKGKIWAESLGAGQGSTFYVELIAKKWLLKVKQKVGVLKIKYG